MSNGILSEMLTNFFGVQWFLTGRASHAYVKPVLMDSKITDCGLVRERHEEPQGIRPLLDTWCRGQQGDLTAVGQASALVV